MRSPLVALFLVSALACGGEAPAPAPHPSASPEARQPAPGPGGAPDPSGELAPSTVPDPSTAPAPSTEVDTVAAAPPSTRVAASAPVPGALRIVLLASHELLGSERASIDALAALLRARGADVSVELADEATASVIRGWATGPIGAWPASLAGIETIVVLPLAAPTTRADGQRVGAGVSSEVLVARAGAAEPRLRVQLEPGGEWLLDAARLDRVVGPLAVGRAP